MAQTLFASIADHVMSEYIARNPLSPLRSKYPMFGLVNSRSIDGLATTNVVINASTALPDAVADNEGETITGFEELEIATAATITPSSYVQAAELSIEACRRALPGLTYEQVIDAVKRGAPEVVPLIVKAGEEIMQSHYQTAHKALCNLFPSLTLSGGTTNTAPTFAAIVDAITELLDGQPEHRVLAGVFSPIHIGRLREELVTGTGGGLASLWASGYGSGFVEALGDAAPSVAPVANIVGMTLFEAASAHLTYANGTTDRTAGIFCVGRGGTGEPGSVRGFAEFVEGHNMHLEMEYVPGSDTAKLYGRYQWACGIHTDAHGTKFLAKAT